MTSIQLLFASVWMMLVLNMPTKMMLLIFFPCFNKHLKSQQTGMERIFVDSPLIGTTNNVMSMYPCQLTSKMFFTNSNIQLHPEHNAPIYHQITSTLQTWATTICTGTRWLSSTQQQRHKTYPIHSWQPLVLCTSNRQYHPTCIEYNFSTTIQTYTGTTSMTSITPRLCRDIPQCFHSVSCQRHDSQHRFRCCLPCQATSP